MPITEHFVAGTPSRYYNWLGLNKDKEKSILLDEIQKTDNFWYEHLMRDCRD